MAPQRGAKGAMRATLHRLNKLTSPSYGEGGSLKRKELLGDREVSYAMRLLQRGNSAGAPASKSEATLKSNII